MLGGDSSPARPAARRRGTCCASPEPLVIDEIFRVLISRFSVPGYSSNAENLQLLGTNLIGTCNDSADTF